MPEEIPPPSSAPAPPESAGILRGFAIILAFNLTGLFLAQTCVPLPGPVIGLGLLAIGLFSGLIKVGWVEKGAVALLQNMMLFFVPALVGMVDLLPALGPHMIGFLAAIVVSLFTVLFVTGGMATLLAKFSGSKKNSENPSSTS